eukprot:22981-Pleurochrysis_carterae.AAC.1
MSLGGAVFKSSEAGVLHTVVNYLLPRKQSRTWPLLLVSRQDPRNCNAGENSSISNEHAGELQSYSYLVVLQAELAHHATREEGGLRWDG